MPQEIQVDDEVWATLKEQAEPFVDTPNSVIRRLLDMPAPASTPHNGAAAIGADARSTRRKSRGGKTKSGVARKPRARTGTILPDGEYELPILAILDENGGRAPTREVLDTLGERLHDRLMPADHEPLASGDIRWRNRAQFARLHLIETGDMKADSPRGLWELSDQGRDRLVSQ